MVPARVRVGLGAARDLGTTDPEDGVRLTRIIKSLGHDLDAARPASTCVSFLGGRAGVAAMASRSARRSSTTRSENLISAQASAPPFLRPVLECVMQETTARLRNRVIGVPHPGAVQDPGGVRDAPIIRSDPVAEGSSGRGRGRLRSGKSRRAASRKGTLTAPARTGHVVMASSGWTSKRQTMIAS